METTVRKYLPYVLAYLFLKGKISLKGGGGRNAGALGVTYYPVTGSAKVISGYGPRGSSFHYGVDIGAPAGRAVVACVAGSVRYGTDAKGGNVAIVTSQDGTAFYYAHLSGFEGDSRIVAGGEVIGYVGNTGNASTTVPHCHFELWPTGKYQPNAPDPSPFLSTAKHLPAETSASAVAASTEPGTAATTPTNVIPIGSRRPRPTTGPTINAQQVAVQAAISKAQAGVAAAQQNLQTQQVAYANDVANLASDAAAAVGGDAAAAARLGPEAANVQNGASNIGVAQQQLASAQAALASALAQDTLVSQAVAPASTIVSS